MIYILKSIWIFQHSHAKLNKDINTSLCFTFLSEALLDAAPPITWAFKHFPWGHVREGKHSQNVPKIRPSRITQALAHCEHKGQKNGLILHIIFKRTGEVHIQRRNLPPWPFNLSNILHINPPRAFFWMLSPDASAVIIWGFLCLDMALKTQRDKKRRNTVRKNVRKSREERIEGRERERENKGKRISPRETIRPGNKSGNVSWHCLHSHLWPPN